MTFEEYIKKNYGCEHYELCMLFGEDLEKAWNASAEVHKPRWVPVSERLPDKDGWHPVINSNKGNAYFNDFYSKGAFFYKDTITHWLELPELPE